MGKPPKSICIVRLSAIGDVTHMVPVVRTIQKHWPDTELTWIIGKSEARLVHDIPDIEFIKFDKANAIRSYRSVFRKTRRRKFDVLLCAQVSLRANFIGSMIPAEMKLGYDKERSKDLHSFFIRQRIKPVARQHVLDSFFSFIEHVGLPHREMNWNYSIPDEARQFARRYLAEDRFKLIISPCSTHPLRNWSAERYAAVADFAARSLDAQVILCGGSSQTELRMGEQIESYMKMRALNLIGKDTLKQFLALLQGADVIISPDSGPAHIATGLGTPVIGLYAASNPRRSGPYFSQQWCVDRYDEAAHVFKNKSENELKWGTKLEYRGVMDLIAVEDVTSKLQTLVNHQ